MFTSCHEEFKPDCHSGDAKSFEPSENLEFEVLEASSGNDSVFSSLAFLDEPFNRNDFSHIEFGVIPHAPPPTPNPYLTNGQILFTTCKPGADNQGIKKNQIISLCDAEVANKWLYSHNGTGKGMGSILEDLVNENEEERESEASNEGYAHSITPSLYVEIASAVGDEPARSPRSSMMDDSPQEYDSQARNSSSSSATSGGKRKRNHQEISGGASVCLNEEMHRLHLQVQTGDNAVDSHTMQIRHISISQDS